MTGKRRKRGSGSVYKRGNSWVISYSYMGKQQRERVGPIGPVTKGMAEKALTVRLAEIAQGKFNLIEIKSRKSFYDLIDIYLNRIKKFKKSYNRSLIICNHFKKFFGNKNLFDIDTSNIEKYMEKRQSDGVKNSTINRELTTLKSMYNQALNRGIFHGTNPVNKINYLKIGKQPDRILSDNEFLKLYRSAADHLKPILKCAINTGMRKSEILKLEWKDVDILEERITVRDTKNLDFRIITISEPLKQMFISMKKESEFIFTYEGKQIKECYRSFKTALKNSGIQTCRFHDLRHTFATNLIMNGYNIVTVQELLGHKSLLMTRRYSHPTPENKKNAVNSLVKFNNVITEIPKEETQNIH